MSVYLVLTPSKTELILGKKTSKIIQLAGIHFSVIILELNQTIYVRLYT